jgi:hypothetical protein
VPMTFHEREQAFEAKFAHDEEFRFRLAARRDKLFAQWAARTLRLSGETSEILVKTVLAIPNGPTHDQALLRHVADFALARGIGGLGEGLAAALDRSAQQALEQLLGRQTLNVDQTTT